MDGGMTNRRSLTPHYALSGVYRRLLNEFQRTLPLSPRPFRDIAERLAWNESAVIAALTDLIEDGVVSRVGPVIRPNTIGLSTLAAMAVPPERLEAVANLVTRRLEVNHNYEREHRFNLWFVITATDAPHLNAVIREIEVESGLAIMVLPMLDDYYIDLGFDLDGGDKPRYEPGAGMDIDDMDRHLLLSIQSGLPLVSKPFESIGMALAVSEWEVRARLRRLLVAGVIRRLGVIVRHHECGYRHNAMVVWDVPEYAVHETGRRLASENAVRLCYRRPRREPDWPYNLYCMIHGLDRQAVEEELVHISARESLDSYPREVLFSLRRFKQRGARYDADFASAVGDRVIP